MLTAILFIYAVEMKKNLSALALSASAARFSIPSLVRYFSFLGVNLSAISHSFSYYCQPLPFQRDGEYRQSQIYRL